MIDILVEVLPNHKSAMQELEQFANHVYEHYRNKLECNDEYDEFRFKVCKNKGYIEIGDYRCYFISEEEYFRWCKGRTYFDKDGHLMKSGNRVEIN